MDTIKFRKSSNDIGRITDLEIEGKLVLENSQQLKKELVDIIGSLNDQVKITITKLEEIDLSCIQLIVAFINRMDELNVTYQFNWKLDPDQKLFLENIGFSNEFLMIN
jgi:anti-anti-sigma regulatory factor